MFSYSLLLISFSLEFRASYGALSFSIFLFPYPYTSLILSFKQVSAWCNWFQGNSKIVNLKM